MWEKGSEYMVLYRTTYQLYTEYITEAMYGPKRRPFSAKQPPLGRLLIRARFPRDNHCRWMVGNCVCVRMCGHVTYMLMLDASVCV